MYERYHRLKNLRIEWRAKDERWKMEEGRWKRVADEWRSRRNNREFILVLLVMHHMGLEMFGSSWSQVGKVNIQVGISDISFSMDTRFCNQSINQSIDWCVHAFTRILRKSILKLLATGIGSLVLTEKKYEDKFEPSPLCSIKWIKSMIQWWGK